MSKFKKLTKNGETFYPIASTEGLINKNGDVVGEINDIFDISEYNASGDPLVLEKYGNLYSALQNIPLSKQKGGMTVRFVQSSDNKYVQFRLTNQTFSSDPSNWVEDSSNISGASKIHNGEFNANTTTEEGWYDAVILGRPEGCESDEKLFMYQSQNGGQFAYSRRNSGKTWHRLGNGALPGTSWHPWVETTHDDYCLQHSTAMSQKSYTVAEVFNYLGWQHPDQLGYGQDPNTELAEVYAGDNAEVSTLHLYRQIHLRPNDIIKVRCTYRRGFSNQGVNTYPFDSDAYLYVNDQEAKGHDLAHLKSDIIKVRSLGSWGFPFTEGETGWQDLAFIRDRFFQDNTEYGWHYLKSNVNEEGDYYLQIAGDFSSGGSWFVIDKVIIFCQQDELVITEEEYDMSPLSIGTLDITTSFPFTVTDSVDHLTLSTNITESALNLNITAGHIVGDATIEYSDSPGTKLNCYAIIDSVDNSHITITLITKERGELQNNIHLFFDKSDFTGNLLFEYLGTGNVLFYTLRLKKIFVG